MHLEIVLNNFSWAASDNGSTGALQALGNGSIPLRSTTFMKTKTERIAHEEKYILFLETRLKSANFKANVSEDEFSKTQEKLKKAKLVLKILKT